MVIYGVAVLSFCMVIGVFAGDLLGQLIGVEANVGGVGIAMLLHGGGCLLAPSVLLLIVRTFTQA